MVSPLKKKKLKIKVILAFSNGCPRMSRSAALCPDPTAGAAEDSWKPSCISGALIPCRQVDQASPGSRGSTCWARLLFWSEALMHLQYSESFWCSSRCRNIFLVCFPDPTHLICLSLISHFSMCFCSQYSSFTEEICLLGACPKIKIQPIISCLSKCYCAYYHIEREEASEFVITPIVNGYCTQAGTAFRSNFCIR